MDMTCQYAFTSKKDKRHDTSINIIKQVLKNCIVTPCQLSQCKFKVKTNNPSDITRHLIQCQFLIKTNNPIINTRQLVLCQFLVSY